MNNLAVQEFSTITLKVDENLIESNFHSKRIRSKLSRVLELLIKNQNNITLRKEILEKVWYGNYYTGEPGMTHTICCLRKLLKDFSGNSIQINTIPKCGYILLIDHRAASLNVSHYIS